MDSSQSLFPLGLILRSLLRLGLRWSGERRRLACCPRRPAESGSDGSGETPKPTRGTRVLPGPLTLISAMPRGLPRGCLLFHGLSGLKQSVQGLASRRVRSWLARWSQSTFVAGFGGFILGSLTQSVTAVAFIVASLAGGGLLTLRRALPGGACANVGP